MKNDVFIVVADDDPDDRFLIGSAFTDSSVGARLEFVQDGVELIELLERVDSISSHKPNFPGFILLDLNMPRKDGRETLKEIKTNARYKHIPVIIFSTSKREDDIVHCYSVGANSFITKPVSFDGLHEIVKSLSKFWLETASLPY
jgi:two-component system response regulator